MKKDEILRLLKLGVLSTGMLPALNLSFEQFLTYVQLPKDRQNEVRIHFVNKLESEVTECQK